MFREVSAMELRQNLGGLLNLVSLQHEPIIIRRADQAIAVLIDMDTFHEKIMGTSPSRSLRDFSNEISAPLKNYQFNRDDANDR